LEFAVVIILVRHPVQVLLISNVAGINLLRTS